MVDNSRRRKLRASILGALTLALLMLVFCFPFKRGAAQSGALIPSSLKDKPDESILSLQVMNVDVLVDNQHARVRVLQIFDSHSAQILEGKYLFALSPRATVSDFAVWDGDTRIPGVMLEKRRANALYAGIKQQRIDPGLLQQDDEHEGSSAFSAKVFPIPAFGTKRVEMEYTEMLPVEGLTSRFSFPLKPAFGEAQHVGEFNLHVRVISDSPFTPPQFSSEAYTLRAIRSLPGEYEGDFQARDIELKDDFAFDYRLEVPQSALSWLAYRAPERMSAYDLRDPALAASNPGGYFEAQAIFNEHADENGARRVQASGGEGANADAENATGKQARNIILMLDTSLSMHGEKLARAVEALDYFLHGLSPRDTFALVLFNEETSLFSDTPLPATADNVERAMAFVKGSMLGGGTDIRKALAKALEVIRTLPTGERSVVLITDANPTLGTTNLKDILCEFDSRKNSVAAPAARVFAFAVGGDANQTLLRELAASSHGYFAQARETEDIWTQLRLFFDKVGTPTIEGLRFSSTNQENFYQIYSTSAFSFDGSSFAFVGRYRKPQPQVSVNVQGRMGDSTINLTRAVSLPEFEDTHAHLPRLWARARVDALLNEMNLSGEREDFIAEIIRLSQKYKFVTPYTAFLAAPRALLRPRLIQPGDPVIRVRTDESVKSVFAVLPFGETLPLKGRRRIRGRCACRRGWRLAATC
ncbi:MAG: VIT and VWA domain-containing protein [Acidobacteria bacterium]|nr:VIT and VWA domain-containing protein [Acidobacteriota bacterium]